MSSHKTSTAKDNTDKPKTVPLGEHENVQVVTPQIADFSSYLNFGEITQNSVGLKETRVNYDGGMLLFQTPKMYCPYGLSVSENPEKDGKPASKSYRLTLSFKGIDNDGYKLHQKLQSHHDMLQELDDAVVAEAKRNSLAWLKLKPASATDDVVRALFNPSIKVSRDPKTQEPDGKWPSTFNCSLLNYGGRWETEAYDKNGQPLDIETGITKGCYVKALVHAQRITFPQGKFGVRYNILNMKVWQSKYSGSRMHGCMIQDDTDDEE